MTNHQNHKSRRMNGRNKDSECKQTLVQRLKKKLLKKLQKYRREDPNIYPHF